MEKIAVLINKKEIANLVNEIAKKIIKDNKEKETLYFVTVLTGAKTFANDLIKKILAIKKFPIKNYKIRLSSYGTKTESSGKIKIVKDINPNKVKIECLLNDKIVQSSNTKNFIFKVEKLISFISKVMTLEPGDIVTTGTPAGIGPMKNGDKVEVRIEGIGVLENFVR